MTLFDQFLTLIAFPFCFVIQWITTDSLTSRSNVILMRLHGADSLQAVKGFIVVLDEFFHRFLYRLQAVDKGCGLSDFDFPFIPSLARPRPNSSRSSSAEAPRSSASSTCL